MTTVNKYRILQQLSPENVAEPEQEECWQARLATVGDVQAQDGSQAIDEARKMPAFRRARGLARFPIVELVAGGA